MDILEAASLAGVTMKRHTTNGKEYAGPCPKCGGTDRFHVWPGGKGGGNFWCRMCNFKGDLVQLLVDCCGMSFKDAFAAAGREPLDNYRVGGSKFRTGIKAPAGPPPFEPTHYEPPNETWQGRAQALADLAHANLVGNDKALAFLLKRGIDEKAVNHFRLGYFSGENNRSAMFRPRSVWGLPEELRGDGRKKMLWIPRGFIIPTFKDGLIHRIRIRRPAVDLKKKSDVKYYVLPGSSMGSLVINQDKNIFVIVEAELDAMMVASLAGSLVGVVAVGSATTKPDAGVFYSLKKAIRILVSLDYDTAGTAGWKWWKDTFTTARLLPPPEGKDPGDAFQAGIDIKAWIRMALPPVATMDDDDTPVYTPPDGLSHLEELRMLLGKYPVTLRADMDTARVVFEPGFSDQVIRQRIKTLFFNDDEVHWYLRQFHPDTIITGDNCYVQ